MPWGGRLKLRRCRTPFAVCLIVGWLCGSVLTLSSILSPTPQSSSTRSNPSSPPSGIVMAIGNAGAMAAPIQGGTSAGGTARAARTTAASGIGAGAGAGSFSFEVWGKVQGVFFRKHTQKRAAELGLSGWVANTASKTVVGEVEGDAANLDEMEQWLRSTGSPKSRIDRVAVKRGEAGIAPRFSGFDVRK